MMRCDLNDHDFEHQHARGERRVYAVLAITLVTMFVEIFAGLLFNSMALTADGWHMGTHAAAFGITLFAYHYARKHARDPRFSFGTGKVGVLGGFASAVALSIVALLMAVESLHRMFEPREIRFNEAILVAVVGLIVNLISALLLKDEPHHHHDHGHHHEDHNLKAAYFHVLADALTSIAAIVALTLGRAFGWNALDSAMGVVGALVIAKWAVGLLKETSAILLDGDVDPAFVEEIRENLEREEELAVTDLHVWSVAPEHYAVICAVEGVSENRSAEIKARLRAFQGVVHVTVEARA